MVIFSVIELSVGSEILKWNYVMLRYVIVMLCYSYVTVMLRYVVIVMLCYS